MIRFLLPCFSLANESFLTISINNYFTYNITWLCCATYVTYIRSYMTFETFETFGTLPIKDNPRTGHRRRTYNALWRVSVLAPATTVVVVPNANLVNH